MLPNMLLHYPDCVQCYLSNVKCYTVLQSELGNWSYVCMLWGTTFTPPSDYCFLFTVEHSFAEHGWLYVGALFSMHHNLNGSDALLIRPLPSGSTSRSVPGVRPALVLLSRWGGMHGLSVRWLRWQRKQFWDTRELWTDLQDLCRFR